MGGIGGGFVGSLIVNQIMAGRANSDTAEGIVGLGASWAVGGWKGLLGYAVLRLATTGFSFGGRPIGFRQTAAGGGGAALGVRVLQ